MKENANINFVKKDQTLLKIQAKRSHIIQSVSMIILGVYALFLILVFSYSTFLSFQFQSTEKNIQKEIKEIEKLTPIEAKYLILKQKAEAGVATSQSMYRYQDLIEALFRLIPSDLLVSGFTVDEENYVVFSAKTNNPYTIDDFISKVFQYNTTQSDSKLVSADINSVSVDKEGIYNLNIKFFVQFTENS